MYPSAKNQYVQILTKGKKRRLLFLPFLLPLSIRKDGLQLSDIPFNVTKAHHLSVPTNWVHAAPTATQFMCTRKPSLLQTFLTAVRRKHVVSAEITLWGQLGLFFRQAVVRVGPWAWVRPWLQWGQTEVTSEWRLMPETKVRCRIWKYKY